MTTVTIPTIGSDPYKITINGYTYSYKAGSTVSVPDEVASAINNAVRLFPAEDPPAEGAVLTFGNNAGKWESPDTAPTSGSAKTVSSGGVYQAIEDAKVTDEQLKTAAEDVLEDHPEWTTTVEDGAVTTGKLAAGAVTQDKLSMETRLLWTYPGMTECRVGGWNVAQKASGYDDYSFTVSGRIPYGVDSVLRFISDTDFTCEKITFIDTSGSAISGSTIYPPAFTAKVPYIIDITFGGSRSVNKIRIYKASATVNLTLEWISAADLSGTGSNDFQQLSYISNFSVNKASSITGTSGWAEGYSITGNRVTVDSGYAYTELEVNKGDYIRITYPEGNCIDSTRYVLSEKLAYGTGDSDYNYRCIFKGRNALQRVFEYIFERGMTVAVCGRRNTSSGGSTVVRVPTVQCWAVPAFGKIPDYAQNTYTRFPYNETVRKMSVASVIYNGGQNFTLTPAENTKVSVKPSAPVTFVHFSDIHNSTVNAAAIQEFVNRFSNADTAIDDILLTGDMCASSFTDYSPMYALDAYKKILLCIGNHDVYDGDGTHSGSDNKSYWATAAQKYSQYISPTVAQWSVTQPEGASTNGLCYYYKDYVRTSATATKTVTDPQTQEKTTTSLTNVITAQVRLIVLDCMAYDDDQHAWLVDVLDDAKDVVDEDTGVKPTVVIADHFPPINGSADVTGFDTPFVSLRSGMEYGYNISYLQTSSGYKAADAVDDFITAGGEFACWLCGHLHYDQIAVPASHPNQIYIAVPCAKRSAVWLDSPRVWDTPSEDCFNLVAIEPLTKTIKVERVGATTDDWGREHDHISIDYSTRTMLATSW